MLSVSHLSYLHSFAFSLLCLLDESHYHVFKFADPFFCFILSCWMAVEFFSSVTVFFSSVISVWYLLMFSLFKFSFCSCIVFLISFISLCSFVAHWTFLRWLFWILCQVVHRSSLLQSLFQLAQIEILEVSQTFYGACVHYFPIRKICQFSFSGAYSLLLPLVSMVLQFLWHCNRYWTLLYSVAPSKVCQFSQCTIYCVKSESLWGSRSEASSSTSCW